MGKANKSTIDGVFEGLKECKEKRSGLEKQVENYRALLVKAIAAEIANTVDALAENISGGKKIERLEIKAETKKESNFCVKFEDGLYISGDWTVDENGVVKVSRSFLS